MKHLLLSLFVGLLSMVTLGQGSIDYTLQVRDNQGRPMRNTDVVLVETTTKDRKAFKTNTMGQVSFTLDEGKEWGVSVKKMINCKYLDVPERGSGSGSGVITYDYETWLRDNRPPADRSAMNLELVEVDYSRTNRPPDNNHSLIILHLQQPDGTPLRSYPIEMTCYKLGKTYRTRTDAGGKARFVLKNDNDYEIDIDGIESYTWCDLGERSLVRNMVVQYMPTNIREKIVDGYIEQIFPKELEPTSARAHVTVNVQGGPNDGKKEYVYLQQIGSNKMYRAKTDENGTAIFMLPKQRKYMVNFEYQHDVDVINLMRVKGFAHSELSVTYVPDPRLMFPERYFPAPEELLVQEFNDFLKKQYPEPDKDPIAFHAKWGNKINKDSKEALMEIALTTKKDPGPVMGPPVNVCFVIDKSGSMAGEDRIEVVKKSLVSFINNMRPSDRAGIVVFDTDSMVAVNSMRVGDGEHLKDVINSIEAGGGTNIYSGMVTGYEEVLKSMVSGGTNRVILLTDGYGETEPSVVVQKSKEYNAKGVEISCIGVGLDYNKSLLKLLATAGGGLIHMTGNAGGIDDAFNQEMSDLLFPIAEDAMIEVIYNGKVVYRQLYGFPADKKKEGLVEMKMENIYPGMNRVALVKFDLDEPTKEIEQQPVTVRLSYTDMKTKQHEVREQEIPLEWAEATGELDMIIDREQKKLYAIAIMNQSMKVMVDAFAAKDYEKARTAVERAMKQVEELYPDANPKDVEELIERMTVYLASLNNLIKNPTQRI